MSAPNFDPKAVEALNELLGRVSELQKSGAMDALLQTLKAVSPAAEEQKPAESYSLADTVRELSSPEVINSLKELKEVYRSGKLKDISEVMDVIPLVLNTLTEKMLERNITMGASLLKIANEAADPDMIEAVREVKNLQKSGNLKILTESSYLVGLMANVVTDSMVQRLVSVLSAFVEEVSTPQMQDILRSMTKCMTRTIHEFVNEPPAPSMSNLLGLMRDPEVRMGMLFMATMSKNMYQSLMENYK
ncbi:MAG: DUF1641 domain-containing protein [Nitrospiraceae bacterium]|nr:DUF1641 domain-containing protein [Nitrospiraceae bacterium]